MRYRNRNREGGLVIACKETGGKLMYRDEKAPRIIESNI